MLHEPEKYKMNIQWILAKRYFKYNQEGIYKMLSKQLIKKSQILAD